MLPALSQLLSTSHHFGLAGTSPFAAQSAQKTLLKVKVSDFTRYVNVFFLCS